MKFRMLFPAVPIDFQNSKLCLIGEWSIAQSNKLMVENLVEKLENVINGIPILAQSVTHHLVTASTLYDIQRKNANI